MKFLRLKNDFIRHTGLMFIGISLFNLFNLLFQLFMLRMLPSIDYGHLNTLVALFMIISVPAGITLLCFMILTNLDLILVKHFFSPTETGYYSIAQIAEKIILFLPLPIVMVMFPKLSWLKTKNNDARALSILWQSLTMTSVLCGAAVALCFFFPSFVIYLLSGESYLECIPLLKWFCVNMTFFAFNFIILYYHLSIPPNRFLRPLFFLTMIQIVLIILFHNSLNQVLFSVGVIVLCLTGLNFFLVYLPRHKVLIG